VFFSAALLYYSSQKVQYDYLLLKIHSKTNPKFTKKNHERNENLEDKQLGMWYASLLGKIKLL
jgi:hypothetical protein